MYEPQIALTKEQLQVVKHDGGHAKVSAVAGSGKTATLVERAAYLIEEKNVDPNRILVLMFNKDAAIQFQSRLEDRLFHPFPVVKTFHAFGASMLKKLSVRCGAIPQTMGTAIDSIKLTKECLASSKGGNGWGIDNAELEVAQSFIDLTKATLNDPTTVYANLDSISKTPHLLDFAKVYENVRIQRGLYFFSDMIKTPVETILANPSLASDFQGRFDYVIVDEYQDINDVQQEMVRIIAGDNAEVMVVGDCDQCIYQWRGAQPEFLLSRFEQDFPGASKYTLSMTFRYGSTLALAANNVITRNKARDLNLVISSPNALSTTIENKIYTGYEDTKSHIVDTITEHQLNGGRLSEVGILGRLYSSMAQPELALLESGIPYTLNGGKSVLSHSISKFIYGCFTVITGHAFYAVQSERLTAFREFLEFPRTGMTKTQVLGVSQSLAKTPLDYKGTLYRCMSRMGKFQQRSIKERTLLIQSLSTLSKARPATECLDVIQSTLNLKRLIGKTSPNRLQADEITGIWNALYSIAQSRGFTAEEFFDYLDEKRAETIINESTVDDSTDAVNLLSVHRAKGLEWDLVILPALEHDKFPYTHHDALIDNTEDERRLFYVAMTRARRALVTLTPRDQSLTLSGSGSLAPAMGDASRFVHEAHIDRISPLTSMVDGLAPFVPNKSLYSDWIAHKYIERAALI